jgi:tetratricopeptide (TPR) repeat protein
MYCLIRSLVLLFLLACAQKVSANATSFEAEATALFQQGQYEASLQKWNMALQEGQRTAGVYFNIGLTESKLKHIPQAILAFEKARRIKPFSKEIQLAIDAERAKIPGAVVPGKPFFVQVYYYEFLGRLRPGMWAFCGLVLLAGLVLYKVRKGIVDESMSRKGQGIKNGVLVVGMSMLVFGVLAYQQLYRSDEAVVMLDCELRQAPDLNSPSLLHIPAGEKLMLSDSLSGWYQVRLLNFEEGWIEGKCFVSIMP